MNHSIFIKIFLLSSINFMNMFFSNWPIILVYWSSYHKHFYPENTYKEYFNLTILITLGVIIGGYFAQILLPFFGIRLCIFISGLLFSCSTYFLYIWGNLIFQAFNLLLIGIVYQLILTITNYYLSLKKHIGLDYLGICLIGQNIGCLVWAFLTNIIVNPTNASMDYIVNNGSNQESFFPYEIAVNFKKFCFIFIIAIFFVFTCVAILIDEPIRILCLKWLKAYFGKNQVKKDKIMAQINDMSLDLDISIHSVQTSTISSIDIQDAYYVAGKIIKNIYFIGFVLIFTIIISGTFYSIDNYKNYAFQVMKNDFLSSIALMTAQVAGLIAQLNSPYIWKKLGTFHSFNLIFSSYVISYIFFVLFSTQYSWAMFTFAVIQQYVSNLFFNFSYHFRYQIFHPKIGLILSKYIDSSYFFSYFIIIPFNYYFYNELNISTIQYGFLIISFLAFLFYFLFYRNFKEILLVYQKEIDKGSVELLEAQIIVFKIIQLFIMTKQNPYLQANCLSKLLFSWLNSFVWQNRKNTFEQEDHFDLIPEHQIQNLQEKFIKDITTNKSKFIFLIKQFTNFKLYLFLISLETVVQMFSVYIVYQITDYFEHLETTSLDFKFIILSLLGIMMSQFISSVAENYVTYRVTNDLVILKNNYILTILKKSLKLNMKSPSKNFLGNVINLIQTDCQKFQDYGFALIYSIWSVFYCILVFAISFYLLNWVIVVYIGVSLFFMMFSGYMYALYVKLELNLMAQRDIRITLLNNIFNNIRFVKFTVLENFFCKYVYDFKKKELKILNKMYWLIAFVVLINWINPSASLVSTYIVYFLVFKKMSLKQYLSFYQISFSLDVIFMFIPWMFNALMKFYVTLTRINTFMDISNNEREIISSDDENSIIQIQNGNFSYDCNSINKFEEIMENQKSKSSQDIKDNQKENLTEQLIEKQEQKEEYKFRLQNVNIKIQPGELVFIIGQIGSGKSSLLNAILGHMKQEQNTLIKLAGSCSFCPQESFLLTDSIKKNILFFEQEDEYKLQEVIEACQLNSDISKFEEGIEKICTEHGMNLSGGQRLRINLARTLYSDKDIYLFDDPFSALDIHVASKIIEMGIIGYLKNKTRIVVTHSIQYLKYADKIIYLQNGNLESFDSYQKFKQTSFFKKLKETLKQAHHKSEEEEANEEKDKVIEEKQQIKKSIKTQEDEYIKKYFLEEDREKGRQFSLVLKFLRQYFGGYFFIFLLFVISILPSIFFYIGLNYFYDFIKKQEFDDSYYVLMNYSLIMILPCFASFFRFLIQMIFQLKMVKKIHHNMMIFATHAGLLTFFDKIPIARLLNRFTNDLNTIEDEFIWTLNGFLLNCSMFIVSIFVILRNITPFLLIAFVIYFFLCFFLQNLYIAIKKDIYRLENITKTPIVNLCKQIVEGRQVIQILQKEKDILTKLINQINDNNKNVIVKNALNSWFFITLSIFNVFILQFISFGLAIYLLKINVMSSKDFLISITYFIQIIWESKNFLENISNLETSIVCLERCEAFKQIPVEKGYRNFEQVEKFLHENIEKKIKCFVPQKQPGNRLIRYSYDEINNPYFRNNFVFKGEIQYTNLFAKYPVQTDFALKGINLKIENGEKIGICGQTGSGKTTLIKLLSQYLEYDLGSLTIDGYEVNQIDCKKLRSEFLIVSQEIALFKGTILENLNPQYINSQNKKKQQKEEESLLINEELNLSEEYEQEIIKCLIEFGFSQDKLQQGLSYQIDNGGSNLSTGEQQLIAMFRALFTDKRVIILDEATSQIDYETEEKIIQFLYQKIQGKTMISIAHRVNTILGCDRIVVLDNGVIVEEGKTEDLLNDKNSRFCRMYNKINENLS